MSAKGTLGKFSKALGRAWSGYSFIFTFVVIFISYYLFSANLTWNGVMNIPRHSSVVGVIALGMALVIITGQIDLSVGSMLSFVGGLTIMVFNVTGSVPLTVLSALCAGALCGLLNGALVGKAKMPAFIVTLATMLIFRSLTRYICHEIPQALSGGSNSLYKLLRANEMYSAIYGFGNGKLFTFPATGLILILCTALIVYMTNCTKFGRQIYAVGSNERAAALAGINVDRVRILVFVITGFLVGVGAFLWISMNASIDPATTGNSYEMYAIAAVVLGGISMSGGRGKCLGVLFGVLSYTIIDKIIVALKMNTLLNDTVKGAILIIAIIIQTLGPVIKQKLRALRARKTA